MEKIFLIISMIALVLSMVLFTSHFIKYGFSRSLHFGGYLKGALASFLVYVIFFISYVMVAPS